MQEPNEKLVQFPQESSRDVLTDVLRDGARRMLATTVEAEVEDYVAARAATVDAAGRRCVVRNGHLPERAIQTPLGDVRVQQPRVRDRRPVGERETFRSAILPPYLRKTTSLEELYPWLYLKGISPGDFSEALLGADGRHSGGEEGTDRDRRWLPRERAVVARAAAGRPRARARNRSGTRRRRRGPRVLGGGAEGVPANPRTAMLGAQDGERAEQAAERRAAQGEGDAARHLDGSDEGGRRPGVR